MQSRTYTISNTELGRSKDLMYYVITNNLQKIKEMNLVTRTNVNNIIDTINKSTALHYSLQLADSQIANYLLQLGADPASVNSFGQSSFDLSIVNHKKCIYDYVIMIKNEKISDLTEDCTQLKKKLKVEQESKEFLLKSVDNYRINIKDLQSDIVKTNNSNELLNIENNSLKDQNITLKRKVIKLNESIDGFLNNNKK